MKSKFSDNFKAAAKAANVSPEKLAKSIRDLLAPSKCRDTLLSHACRRRGGFRDCPLPGWRLGKTSSPDGAER